MINWVWGEGLFVIMSLFARLFLVSLFLYQLLILH